MSVPVALRSLARQSQDGPQTRRLLALAAIYDGSPRGEAARIGGVGLQTVRDWVSCFNACGPAGLLDRKPPGQPALLSDEHRRQLSAMIEAGPIPAVAGPSAAPVPRRRAISAPSPPTSSGQSARIRVRARAACCPAARRRA